MRSAGGPHPRVEGVRILLIGNGGVEVGTVVELHALAQMEEPGQVILLLP